MMARRVFLFTVIVAGLLFGCGGGGSSSGGSTTDNVTLTFIKMIESATVSSGCTVFAQDSASSLSTYAALAADVTVSYTDAEDGELEYLYPDSDGTLTVDKNWLQDGSYLSIIDSPSDDDHYYKVLSIQKELLESSLVKINRNQGSVSCYKGGAAPTTTSGTITVYTNGDDPVSYYRYLSSQEDSGRTTLNSYTLSVVTGEPALVKGYNGATLNSYVLVDDVKSDPDATLQSLDTTYSWINQVASGTLDSLKVLLGHGSYIYDWISPDVASEEDFDISSAESWYYHATGSLNSGWDFRLNGVLETTVTELDIALSAALSIGSANPSVEEYAAADEVSTGVTTDSEHALIGRAKYIIPNSSTAEEESLEHVVIGVASDGYLTIPELDLSDDWAPVDAVSLEVEVFEVDSLEGPFQQALISQYEDADTVSLVVTPEEKNKHQYYIDSSTYVQLSR